MARIRREFEVINSLLYTYVKNLSQKLLKNIQSVQYRMCKPVTTRIILISKISKEWCFKQNIHVIASFCILATFFRHHFVSQGCQRKTSAERQDIVFKVHRNITATYIKKIKSKARVFVSCAIL